MEAEIVKTTNPIIPREDIDSPEKRLKALTNSFTASIIIIAEMHKNRDWENLYREDGSSYNNLVEVVQDALQVGVSYAYRLVQSATHFYLPLESVTVEGTTIEISSSEVVTLGKSGMQDVVERFENELEITPTEDPHKQSDLLQTIKNDVIKDKLDLKKAKQVANNNEIFMGSDYDLDSDFSGVGFDDTLDFDGDSYTGYEDDLASDLISEINGEHNKGDDDLDSPAPRGAESKLASSLNFDKPEAPQETKPRDATAIVEEVLAGGREYREDSDISTLPEDLQPIIKAFLVLEEMNPIHLASLVSEETRGVVYPMQKAISNARMLKASIETSPWVISQL